MKKVLIIDDEINLTDNIAMFLSNKNFSVIKAYNGIDGIQKAIEHSPDIILCDITMPDINGYDVFNTLSDINSTKSIPFLFLTAKSSSKDILFGLQLGADSYITKPFDLNILLDIINKKLNKFTTVASIKQNELDYIIENPLISIIILKNNIIINANKNAYNLFGYQQNQLINLNLSYLFSTNSYNKIITEINKININSQKTAILNLQAISKNNQPFDIINYIYTIKIKNDKLFVFNIQKYNQQPSHEKLNLNLTTREIEILKLTALGFTNKEIADKLFISKRSVDKHKENIIKKTNVKNITELLIICVKDNLI